MPTNFIRIIFDFYLILDTMENFSNNIKERTKLFFLNFYFLGKVKRGVLYNETRRISADSTEIQPSFIFCIREKSFRLPSYPTLRHTNIIAYRNRDVKRFLALSLFMALTF